MNVCGCQCHLTVWVCTWHVPDASYCQLAYRWPWKMLLLFNATMVGWHYLSLLWWIPPSPPKEHVQVPSLKGCLCVSHSVTHRVAQNAPLELTTKACLSNCAGIRLGYKETHKANVSISCSSESLCLYNQEKHGLNLRCCLGNDAHKTPLYDVDISLNNRFAF